VGPEKPEKIRKEGMYSNIVQEKVTGSRNCGSEKREKASCMSEINLMKSVSDGWMDYSPTC